MLGLGPVIVSFATLTSDGCHERGMFVGMWRLKKTHGLLTGHIDDDSPCNMPKKTHENL